MKKKMYPKRKYKSRWGESPLLKVMLSIMADAELYRLFPPFKNPVRYSHRLSKLRRPTWDEYFMQIARTTATRSTCDRASVGCVLTLNNRIISTGYNGSAPGLEHCDDVGHLMVDSHCVRTIHAEQNAVLFARTDLTGATCYVTHFPCIHCTKILIAAGVKRLVFAESYGTEAEKSTAMFWNAKVLLVPFAQ
jgi:dCMP deaminase